MATFQAAPTLHPGLLSRLQEARSRTDELFKLLPAASFYDRPIAERHRMIFYLGHLEAFDWNLLSAALDLAPHDAEFDKLFAFGIDPVGGGLPTDAPQDWPTIAQVEDYNRVVRHRLDEALGDFRASRSQATVLVDGTLLHVAIEHRLMHAETIAYLLHNLPIERKAPAGGPDPDPRPAPDPRQVTIPAGTATLGQPRGGGRIRLGQRVRCAPGPRAEFFDRCVPGDQCAVSEIRASGRISGSEVLVGRGLGVEALEEAQSPILLDQPLGLSRVEPEHAVGIRRDVRHDSAAAIVARLREPCGGFCFRALGRQKAAHGSPVASRRVRRAGWNRTLVSMGRSSAQ